MSLSDTARDSLGKGGEDGDGTEVFNVPGLLASLLDYSNGSLPLYAGDEAFLKDFVDGLGKGEVIQLPEEILIASSNPSDNWDFVRALGIYKFS